MVLTVKKKVHEQRREEVKVLDGRTKGRDSEQEMAGTRICGKILVLGNLARRGLRDIIRRLILRFLLVSPVYPPTRRKNVHEDALNCDVAR